MINSVSLTGRITRDPEVKKTANGTSVSSYTLAVDRKIKVPGQPEADYIPCVTYGKQADTMAQYLHKGSLIGVEGHIQTRNYDNKQRQRIYITEVITDSITFLEPKSKTSYANQGGYDNGYGHNQGVR